jgi:hypothetical protein
MAKQILRTVQNRIELVANDFKRELETRSGIAWKGVRNILVRELEIQEPTSNENAVRVANNEHNLGVINKAYERFLFHTFTKTLQKKIDTITKEFGPVAEGVAEHYITNIGEPSVMAFNKSVQETKQAQNQWIDYSFNGISRDVLNPIPAELQSMLGGATPNEFLKRAEYLFYTKLITTLAPQSHAFLQNHFRNIQDILGQDLNLVWVKYIRQTSSAERRDFCQKHESSFAGNPKHYHIDEVKRDWPNYVEPGFPKYGVNWSGAIKGTNSNNILHHGGGYNCLHSFEYVEGNKVSNKDRARARNLGYAF